MSFRTASSPARRRAARRLFVPSLCGLALLAAPSCDEGEAAAPETPAPARAALPPAPAPAADAEVARAIRDLVTALTPLPATATTGEEDAWYGRRRATLERLSSAGPAYGEEALRVYLEKRDASDDVRAGLLEVAAENLPERTRPLLVSLVTEFGAPPILRRKACLVLGETSPETAIEILEPILLERRRDRTYPEDDQMLLSYVAACRATGHDPVDVLTTVATDLLRQQDARHRAAKELAAFPSEKTRQALDGLLVESGGNSYLRRMAAQSLQVVMEPEAFCERIAEVLSKEADIDFALFLASMQEKHCR